MGMGMRYSLISMVNLEEGVGRGIRGKTDKGRGEGGTEGREGERGQERLRELLCVTRQITS